MIESRPRRPRRRAWVGVLGKLHNLPNTLVGLAFAAAGTSAASFARVGHNALQFFDSRLVLPGYAITLGNVTIYGRGVHPGVKTPSGATLGEHERQHTLQGEQIGAFYLPSNLLGGLAGLWIDGSWHGRSNWNERGPLGFPPRPW